MQLPQNTLLKNGKYLIVRSLGQGGYGITYLATTFEEVRGNMGTFPVSVPVAIKEFFVKTYCVRDTLTSNVLVPTTEGKELVPRLMKDFVREAKSMSKMDHPNIVKVIDVFEDNQTVYYVMQYLEGRSLADMVSELGPLTNEVARSYIFQVAAAVSYLHDQHVCHYDVKPANIMLLNDNRAVLIDFGISRHYDEQGNSTTVRAVGFSSGFSAPEQKMGEVQKFSPASDIYSLAATLFFMLTGKIPSESHDTGESFPGACPDDVPREMWNAVVAGMQADSSSRPQTVREWLAMLEDNTTTRPQGESGRIPREDGKSEPEEKEKKEEKKKKEKKKNGEKTVSKRHRHWWLWIIPIALMAVGVSAYLLFQKKPHNITGSTGPDQPLQTEVVPQQTEVTEMNWPKKNRYGNTFVYTGTVIDSVPNGKGKARYSDGSYYEGRFRDALRDDSNAKYIDPNGNTFTGSFSNDSIQNGRITAPDGRYYEGSFSDDKPFNGEWHDTGGEVMFHVVDGNLINAE